MQKKMKKYSLVSEISAFDMPQIVSIPKGILVMGSLCVNKQC